MQGAKITRIYQFSILVFEVNKFIKCPYLVIENRTS